MATRRMLNHTVVLYNYIGEVDDVASFQATVISPCFCPTQNGAVKSSQGETSDDSATLYIFDHITKATSKDGTERTYVSYEVWKTLSVEDKAKHWTLSVTGKDYFQKENLNADVRDELTDKFKILVVKRFDSGSRRMWHWEVFGK